MSFYNTLSKYYDVVFKQEEKTTEFLLESLQKGDKVLDVACGTGIYSISLSKKGANVIGVDLDSTMIEKAKAKAKRGNFNIEFLQENMIDLKERFGEESFNIIFCIGNSIVHLECKEQIETVIKDYYEMLKEDGTLIIQIINYDRIIEHGITELPLIDRKEEGVKFIRKYEYSPSKEEIYFKTKIIVNENGSRETIEEDNVITLIPLLKDEMYNMFVKAGFKKIDIFGGFNKASYNLNSYALVVRARK
ncbi:SAM-dependent methyltransferase [Clostridium polyendosporum]|uniref:SAM-dependent methyltransferase n=1 Tax=Clostridium polyendosporum TaxID=69208 RepID=A0A919RW87_9CLOT|nr:class I SAM-dependent methyltransferase [Clostridium polyendosporum]GIM27546.1 SAM-dependent methyltransferase [Clostridium polyendosporum]